MYVFCHTACVLLRNVSQLCALSLFGFLADDWLPSLECFDAVGLMTGSRGIKGYKSIYIQWGNRDLYHPELPKLDLIIVAEYVANFVNKCATMQFITWVYYTCILPFFLLIS